jgi:hypothetical protein
LTEVIMQLPFPRDRFTAAPIERHPRMCDS